MSTARRATYLLLALCTGTFWFSWFVTVGLTGLALTITFLGIPLLGVFLWSIRWFADVERALVHALLGVEVHGHYRRADTPGWWPAARTRIADPQTWKDLTYLFMQFPLGIVSFTLVTVLAGVPLALLFAPAYYTTLEGGIGIALMHADTLGEAIALSVVGIPAAFAGWKLLDGLGAAQAAWAQLMLSSSPDPELTAQVTDARSAQARIIAAADAERQRLERDLHDGAQQRLVTLSLKLAMAKSKLEDGEAKRLIDEAHAESKAAVAELRDLARGIHPSILTDRGLPAAVDELAARSAVPTEVLEVPQERFDPTIESTAYFVVAEALTNVGKYAQAEQASVRLARQPDRLVVEVRDDGRGGAEPRNGLRGLQDRVHALEGRFELDSAPGWGTRVRAELPLKS